MRRSGTASAGAIETTANTARGIGVIGAIGATGPTGAIESVAIGSTGGRDPTAIVDVLVGPVPLKRILMRQIAARRLPSVNETTANLAWPRASSRSIDLPIRTMMDTAIAIESAIEIVIESAIGTVIAIATAIASGRGIATGVIEASDTETKTGLHGRAGTMDLATTTASAATEKRRERGSIDAAWSAIPTSSTMATISQIQLPAAAVRMTTWIRRTRGTLRSGSPTVRGSIVVKLTPSYRD